MAQSACSMDMIESATSVSEAKEQVTPASSPPEMIAERKLRGPKSSFHFCKKNPGHVEFIPINSFVEEHVPPICRNEEVIEWLRLNADLTVKLGVNITSPYRPSAFPDTKLGRSTPGYRTDHRFPYTHTRGLRTGTGFVLSVQIMGENLPSSSKGCLCSKNCSASKWGRISVSTSNHQVYDMEEARSTEAEFFYNTDEDIAENRTVKIDGAYLSDSSVERDITWLDFYSHDVDTLVRLQGILRRRDEIWKELSGAFRRPQENKEFPIFIISHIHGREKYVTIGEEIGEYEALDHSVLHYTAPTCPGSSGAPVLTIRCVGSHAGYNVANRTVYGRGNVVECKDHPQTGGAARHNTFIPFKHFVMEDLHEEWRDSTVFNAVSRLAQNTVKLFVLFVSQHRPEGSVLYEKRGSDCQHLGGGWIDRVEVKSVKSKDGPCRCEDCRTSRTRGKEWYTVIVKTSCETVYDEEEANHTEVEVGLDDENNNSTVRLRHHCSFHSRADGITTLHFITHDDRIKPCFLGSVLSITTPVAASYPSFTVMAFHPHGRNKELSFGTVVNEEEGVVSSHADYGHRKCTYDNPSCIGASGSPLMIIRAGRASCDIIPHVNKGPRGGYHATGTMYYEDPCIVENVLMPRRYTTYFPPPPGHEDEQAWAPGKILLLLPPLTENLLIVQANATQPVLAHPLHNLTCPFMSWSLPLAYPALPFRTFLVVPSTVRIIGLPPNSRFVHILNLVVSPSTASLPEATSSSVAPPPDLSSPVSSLPKPVFSPVTPASETSPPSPQTSETSTPSPQTSETSPSSPQTSEISPYSEGSVPPLHLESPSSSSPNAESSLSSTLRPGPSSLSSSSSSTFASCPSEVPVPPLLDRAPSFSSVFPSPRQLSAEEQARIKAEVEANRALLGGYEMEIVPEDLCNFQDSILCCDKAKRHDEYILAQEFGLQHVPRTWRSEALCKEICRLIHKTVRIQVYLVSKLRPVQNKLYKKRGSKRQRSGSGWVCRVFEKSISRGDEPCQCVPCIASDLRQHEWLEIHVKTARHVVYNLEEARETVVGMDGSGEGGTSAEQELRPYRVEDRPDHAEDTIILICASHEETVKSILMRCMDMDDNLRIPAPKTAFPLVVVVSYPHNCKKSVSFGVKKDEKSESRGKYEKKTYTYDAPTCPGSSGGPVWVIGTGHNTIFPHAFGEVGEVYKNSSGPGYVLSPTLVEVKLPALNLYVSKTG